MVQVLIGVVVYLLRGQSSQTCKAEIFNSASNMPIYGCQPSSLFNQDLLNCNLYITRSLSRENSLSILFKRKWQEAANVVTTAPVAADATATGTYSLLDDSSMLYCKLFCQTIPFCFIIVRTWILIFQDIYEERWRRGLWLWRWLQLWPVHLLRKAIASFIFLINAWLGLFWCKSDLWRTD